MTELANESEAIHALTREMLWLRYYVPESFRDEIERIYDKTLKGH